MGVPAFFRWLSRKYPSIVVHSKEEKAKVIDGVKVPVDITGPNPNGFEFDNLYLDMNGIIHPCCHPENKPAPANEDEMMEDIFEYIDRLVAIVRPRKVLYMAIDGVAPRAKMNQQRSRRFRSSKDSVESREALAKVKEDLRSRGVELPPDGPEREHFDSNCITPGTEFMARLAECLMYYIHVKMNTDPGWSQLMIVLSDANVPGEGEHKIMDYIRRQRSQPDHDPNTRHCLCGADADLIMLGLATHEPNFTIIREEFKPFQERPCEICAQTGHKMTECTGAAKEKQGEFDEKVISAGSEQDFIFLRLNILREYLYKELAMINLPFKEDFERAIDDWVLMCFFVGNDFLPHLPSLEIREGAIDRLIGLYKKVVYKTGGYLTESGHIHLDRVELILENLGEMEDEIFKKRRDSDEHFKRRNEERKRQRQSYDAPAWLPSGAFAPVPLGQNLEPGALSSDDIRRERQQNFQAATQQSVENQRVASDLRRSLGSTPQTDRVPSKSDNKKVEDKADEPKDDVRLWEDGWKDRYYMNKFGVGLDESSFRTEVANQYMLGICWVLKYYYQGCASWNWYFPYHYAPFASDFMDVGKLNLTFPKDTKPFNPLEQLMSVFPAASKKFLPPSWQELMYRDDSKIIDFYPTNFKIDLNGKKQAWQGVALLPFVDESRLLKNLGEVYPNLTDDESRRNSLGNDRLFVHKNHKAFTSLVSLYEGGHDETKVHLNPTLTGGVAGLTWCDERVVMPGDVVKSPLPRLEDFACNQAICVKFLDPRYDAGFIFPAKLLPNAQIPPATLTSRDNFDPNQRHKFQNDREYSGSHDATAAKRMLRGSLNPHGYNVPNNNQSNWNSDRPRHYSQPYDNFSRPHLNPSSYQSYEQPPPSGYGYNQGPPRGPPMGYGQRPPYYQQRNSYQDQNFRNDRRNNHPRFHPYSRQN